MFLPGYPRGPGGPANNYIYQTHVTERSPVRFVLAIPVGVLNTCQLSN